MNILKIFQKYKTLSNEKKAIFFYTFSNFLQKGIAFITLPLITRLLSTSEYGVYSAFLSWKDLLMIFVTLNIHCSVSAKMLVDNINDQDKCLSSLQGLGAITSLFFLIFTLIFINQISLLLGYSNFIIFSLFLYFLVYPSFPLWCAKQRVNNRYKMMTIITIVISIIIPVISIFLLILTSLSSEALIITHLYVYIIVGFVFFFLNWYKGKSLYDKSYWCFAMKFNTPLIPHYLSLYVLGISDRLMIKYIINDAAVGIYSLAYQISSMVNIFYNSVNNTFIPTCYKYLKNGDHTSMRKNINFLSLFGLMLSLLVIIIAPEMVKIVGGTSYVESVYVFPPVIIGVYISFVYTFLSNIEFYFSKTKHVMVASCLSAILNIALNLIFIPVFGYIAAGFTTLASYLFLFIFHAIFAYRILKSKSILGFINFKIIILLVFLSIVFACFAFIIYINSYFRYAVLLLVGFLCFYHKDKVSIFLKRRIRK